MLVGFFAAGFMSRIDPRISMAFGFGLQTVAGLWMLTFDLNVTMEILVINSAVQGLAVGVVWVPITVVAFDTLEAKDYAEASSIFHLLRNIGSSFFISLSIAEIVRTTGANYSRMTEMITPYNRGAHHAGPDGGMELRHRAGPRQGREGDRPSVGDDRLSQCVHDVHGNVGARGRVRPDGPAPEDRRVLR
jgi:DHA2 family multidrug resistance protein